LKEKKLQEVNQIFVYKVNSKLTYITEGKSPLTLVYNSDRRVLEFVFGSNFLF